MLTWKVLRFDTFSCNLVTFLVSHWLPPVCIHFGRFHGFAPYHKRAFISTGEENSVDILISSCGAARKAGNPML